MLKQVKEFFEKAWNWIQAMWDKHDDQLEKMVSAILPMVIDVSFRNDLSGEQKKQAIIDAILDNASVEANKIGKSMLNEAVEIAANRYNIQIGKLTSEKMDNALSAALKAGRDYANDKLELTGDEAEKAGVTLSNEDLDGTK